MVKVYQKKLVIRKRKRFLFISLYTLLALGIIFSGLSWLSQSNSMYINQISIVGTNQMEATVVESIVLKEIAGNFLGFFSKGNTFLYPANNIHDEVLALPFVQSVEVKRNGLQAIEISLEERKESARWCAGEIKDISSCFSVDENGFVFGRVVTSSAFVYRGLFRGEVVGQNILTPEDFKKTQFFVRELGGLGLAPVEALLDNSHYMTVVLFSGGKLIVSTNEDFSIVLSNISSILADKMAIPSVSGFLEKLDYMKLDSGNKVVYKLK